jgi:hypothetical protein
LLGHTLTVAIRCSQEHKLTDKAADAAKATGAAISDFDKKHDITGKVTGGISAAMNGLTRALSSNKEPPK